MPLAPIEDPKLVTQAVFSALGLQDVSTGWSISTLSDYLERKRLLLVFDNCEHLLDGAAMLASTLLQACPELRVLATSRQALNVAGESRIRVLPLSLPPDGNIALKLDAIASSDAVALLAERAASVLAGFAIDESNAAALLRLCRRLDGMPLALELAAGRLEGLTLNQLLAGLERDLPVLGTSFRGGEPRHRTLEATIGWSFSLLDAPERLSWARLSVFAGGFDEEAAIAVGSGPELAPDRVTGLLASLVEKSILQRDLSMQPPRYSLLETVRQFGRQKLKELGEEIERQTKHLEWILELARALGAFDDRQAEMFRRMKVEHDNLWSALGFCIRQAAAVRHGVEICTHLRSYWHSQGPTNDVRRLVGALAALTDEDSIPRANCLTVGALLAAAQNDGRSALQMGEESLRIGRQLRDDDAVARALGSLIFLAWSEKRFDDGTKLAVTMLELARTMDVKWVRAWALTCLSTLRVYTGPLDEAIQLGQEAAAIGREGGEMWLRGQALAAQAHARLRLGDLDGAEAAAKESAICMQALDDRRSLVALVGILALIAVSRGDGDRVATLLGCSARLLDSIANTLLEIQRERHRSLEEFARGHLSEVAFTAAVDRGRTMTLDEVVAYALDQQPPAKPLRRLAAESGISLTRREQDIAALVAQGLSNKQIAAKLVVSDRTVESHIWNILNKLGFNSRTQIASWTATHQPVGPTVKG